MRPTCKKIAELLLDFIDGNLPEMQMQTMQMHLCGCPQCMFYLETYQNTIELTHALPTEPIPAECAEKLHALLRDWQTEPNPKDKPHE